MTNFVELTDSENNKFIFQKKDISIVFVGGADEEDTEWEGEPSTVIVINNTPTKINESYEEVRNLLIQE